MILSKALLAVLLTATSHLAGAVPTVQSRQNARSYNLPLTWNSFGFLSQISVGTPPQKLPVFVDWTWVGQYLLTTLCHGTNNTHDCLATQQPLFNQSLSSSFRNLTSQYGDLSWDPNHFFFWKPLTVDISSDIVTVGPSSTRMIIQAADFQFDETAAPFPFAGVYGLSPVFKTDNSTLSAGLNSDYMPLTPTQKPPSLHSTKHGVQESGLSHTLLSTIATMALWILTRPPVAAMTVYKLWAVTTLDSSRVV